MAKKIGVRELATLAGVSIGTVDRALNGRPEVSERTRERILEIARIHGYVPNQAARALSVSRSQTRIGVCIPRELHYFYDQVRQGIFDEARRFEQLGVEVLYEPVPRMDADPGKAVQKLEKAGARAIIMTPGRPDLVRPLIGELERKHNIRVVCIGTDDPLSARSSAISVEPRLNGGMAAELMAKIVGPGARVAIVTGLMASDDHNQKVIGFCEAFPRECRGGEVVQIIEGREDEEQTREKCLKLLKSEPELNGIYVSTVNCMPVCRALESAKRTDRISVVATDLFAEAVPYFRSGLLAAAIYQNPYRQGQIAVRMIVDNILHGSAFPHTRSLNPTVVLRSNLELFREVK